MELILASGSPRRKHLLQQIGIEPNCQPVDIDETPKYGEIPLEYCRRLAKEKAEAGWLGSNQTTPVLGSDTIVVLDDEILGKPTDKKNACAMLKSLSGNTHQVITAVAVVNSGQCKVIESISQVVFRKLNNEEIIDYVSSKEPMDKAGSYAIQGKAAVWIKQISGSYSGIMGLPIYETVQLLNEFK